MTTWFAGNRSLVYWQGAQKSYSYFDFFGEMKAVNGVSYQSQQGKHYPLSFQ